MFPWSLVYMVATQSHVPLTLNADLSQTTMPLSFSHFKSCLCLAFMLTWISSGTQQLHIIFLWVCALKVCILSSEEEWFYFNSAVPSRLDASPHFLFSSAFIHHTPLNGHKQSYCYVRLRHAICFVCSSYLCWWRSVQAAGCSPQQQFICAVNQAVSVWQLCAYNAVLVRGCACTLVKP